MQTQSKAALKSKHNIRMPRSHRFFTPDYKANAGKTEINEQYLMSRLAQGDETAFWIIWEQYRTYLHISCMHWLGPNRYEVDDALSRASIKALNSLLNSGRNITHLKSWLSRLTRNICVDIIRERSRHRRSLYHIGELAEIGGWPHAYSPPSAEQALLQSEISRIVRRAVNVLPCRLQIPTMMRFFEDMPYQAIARQLNITPENARKRIQQARAIIHDRLNPYLSGVGDPLVAVKEDDDQDENTCELPSVYSDLDDLESDTVKPCIAPYRPICVNFRNKMEMEFYVPLKNMPKRIQQKIRTLRRYVRKHPRSWKKMLKLADLLYVAGKWPEAADNYHQVLEKQPEFFQVWLQLGNILHLMDEKDRALDAFKSAYKISKNRASRYYVLGLIGMCCDKITNAGRRFKKAASYEPDNSAHWHALGVTLLHINESAEALQAFDLALEINPEDTVALINSSDVLMSMERSQEAKKRLEKVIDISPYDVLGLLRLAEFRIKSGLVFESQGAETRQVLRQVLSLAPKSIDAFASLAYFYRTKGNIEKSTSAFQKALELHPTNPYAQFNYALWLSNLCDCDCKLDAVCPVGAFTNNCSNLYAAPLIHVLSFQNNENICTAVKETINCSPRRWSVYATTGISTPILS